MTALKLPPQKEVAPSHIEEQWYTLLGWAQHFASERREKVIQLLMDFRHRIKTAPASAKVTYHNAYEGGYLDHILNVINTSKLVSTLYESIGGVVDFTDEERIFAAMFHDLGKLGDESGPRYVIETDEFWRKKGHFYGYNDNGQRLSVFDRTMYILSQYEIKFSKTELVGIRMADGVFDPANKHYYDHADFNHRTNLGYIIHWSDWMSTMTEKDDRRKLFEEMNNV